MKLCKDCRFSDITEIVAHSRCGYVYPDKIDPVVGGPVRQPYDFCSVLRASTVDHNCGPDARFFEAKA
jgi:hypothetical protein